MIIHSSMPLDCAIMSILLNKQGAQFTSKMPDETLLKFGYVFYEIYLEGCFINIQYVSIRVFFYVM